MYLLWYLLIVGLLSNRSKDVRATDVSLPFLHLPGEVTSLSPGHRCAGALHSPAHPAWLLDQSHGPHFLGSGHVAPTMIHPNSSATSSCLPSKILPTWFQAFHNYLWVSHSQTWQLSFRYSTAELWLWNLLLCSCLFVTRLLLHILKPFSSSDLK